MYIYTYVYIYIHAYITFIRILVYIIINHQTYSGIHIAIWCTPVQWANCMLSARHPAIPQRQDINEDNVGYYNAGRHLFKTSWFEFEERGRTSKSSNWNGCLVLFNAICRMSVKSCVIMKKDQSLPHLAPWGMRAARARCGGPDCALIVNPMHHRTVEQLLARDLGDGCQIVMWTFGCSFSSRGLWNTLDFRMLCDTTPNMSFSQRAKPWQRKIKPNWPTSFCCVFVPCFLLGSTSTSHTTRASTVQTWRASWSLAWGMVMRPALFQ